MTMTRDAKKEATARRNDGNGNNAIGGQSQWAYSPATGAVGMRSAHEPESTFRIVNVNYPMYGRADEVKDWVSVGQDSPKRGWHWRRDAAGLWKQHRDVPGTQYTINEFGSRVEDTGKAVACQR